MRKVHTTRGHCRPFGATIHGDSVNFAVFSRHAQSVVLLLYDVGHDEPMAEVELDAREHKTGDIWHVMVHGIRVRQTSYAFRAFGPWEPEQGHRFDGQRILFDPYAIALTGGETWGSRPDRPGPTANPLRRSRITSSDFDWEGDKPLGTPLRDTIIYELHVRGYTIHPTSGVGCPGTFLGLCEKIPYLSQLGITAVQLMPALDFDELDQARTNPSTGLPLLNYWGYSPVSFFAPKASYASVPQSAVTEFKEMVKRFHRGGIEVILDVVYNHTCEGNENGPTVCYRGFDNSIYYSLDHKGRYYNFSGCGNTLNCNHPLVRDLIIESLSYLVSELHVDGFRFDLAAILGRGANGQVLEDPPLIKHIAEHPVLAGVKLIAEAWDAAGLSQLGRFPAWGRWAELNGVFRDDARRFIRGEARAVGAIARRICGSVDIYGDASRHPHHSVNFVTCHDGFTLTDLVSYNQKHNEANGESNADGVHDNLSWNCGVEGATDRSDINDLRARQIRNFLVLLLTSQGVPALLGGDELGRTQQGNNNAYCQDNELSWMNWLPVEQNAGMLRFATMMISLRKRHFALTRDEFNNRITWHGTRLGRPDWSGESRTLALQMHGWQSRPDVYVIYNMHWTRQRFALPPTRGQFLWRRVVDTNLGSPDDIVEDSAAVWLNPADHYVCVPRSAVLLMAWT